MITTAKKRPEATLRPSRFDVLLPFFLIGGALLTAAGFICAFTIAPLVYGATASEPAVIGGQVVTNRLLLSQKIFYFHMPVAVTSMAALAFTALFGVLFLLKRRRIWDTRARIATEISLVFIMMTMVSGELWERFEWGVWWTWEPRLTTYFILMLLVIGYFILRNAIDDPERRATYASIFGILAFIDAPVSLMITRLVPSGVHPVIFRTDSGLSPEMLIPLLLSMAGFAAVACALYRLRLREQLLRQRLEALTESLED
jgi:heme exporter protein C